MPRLLLLERDKLAASCIPGEPPHWRPVAQDPFGLFHFALGNRLLADGWDVADAALVVAAGRLSAEVGRRTVGAAIRIVWLDARRAVRR